MKGKITYLSIDAEFWGERIIKYNDIKLKFYENAFMGVFNPHTGEYKHFPIRIPLIFTDKHHYSIPDLENYILKLDADIIVLLTYFSPAEIQFLDFLKTPNYKRIKVLDLGNTVYLRYLHPSGKIIVIADTQRLTGTSNLESLVKSFVDENDLTPYNPPITLSEWFEIKGKRENIGDLDYETVVKYNQMDCILQWVGLKNFERGINNIIKNAFGFRNAGDVKIDGLKVITIGGFISKWLHRYDKKYRNFLYEVKTIKKGKNYKHKFIIQFIRDAVYKGGGLIHTFNDNFKIYENVKVMDFSSLFPHSLMGALLRIPRHTTLINYISDGDEVFINGKFKRLTEGDIKSIYNSIQRNKNYYAFYLVEFKTPFPIIPCKLETTTVKQKDKIYFETDKMIVFPKNGISWISKDELKVMQKLKKFKIKKIHEVIYWKVEPYYELHKVVKGIIKRRMHTEDKTEKEILKIILNAGFYGKLVEKRITPISNYLLGALLTAISRTIMMDALIRIKKAGNELIQTATDSIFYIENNPINWDDFSEWVDKLIGFKPGERDYPYWKVEVENGKMWFVRNKFYYVEGDNGVVKEAHHGVSIGNVKEFWENILNNFNERPFIETYKDSYIKLKTSLRYKENPYILCKAYLKENTFQYIPDNKNLYDLTTGKLIRPFIDVKEFKKFLKVRNKTAIEFRENNENTET